MISKLKKMFKNSFIFKQIDKAENKYYQKKLTNTEFTILCPNCVGGLIYHRLGEKFNSPTIDLTINSDDFCSFLENLEYYVSTDVEYHSTREDGVPIGIIRGNETYRDIKIYFTHYKDFDKARDKWNERKLRIKKDNTYAVMYDIGDFNQEDYKKAGYLSNENLEKFENFKCNNKVLLTSNPNHKSKYAHYIKPNFNGPYPLVYLNRGITGLMQYEKEFDFVGFINKK